MVLAIHPTQTATLYLGTVNDGVYRSDNGGANWTARNEGLDNLHVSALAIDPLAPETVYAGTENGGLFRSVERRRELVGLQSRFDREPGPGSRRRLRQARSIWGIRMPPTSFLPARRVLSRSISP